MAVVWQGELWGVLEVRSYGKLLDADGRDVNAGKYYRR